MFGYMTLGTNDLERAVAFYDALLAEAGAQRLVRTERMAVWGTGKTAPTLMVTQPFDGQAATHGNGVMVALEMTNRAKVDKFYRKAIDLGATDEGAPGPRGKSGFYAGYFRDPDGNKLNAFCSD